MNGVTNIAVGLSVCHSVFPFKVVVGFYDSAHPVDMSEGIILLGCPYVCACLHVCLSEGIL